MMTGEKSGSMVGGESGGRKHELPSPIGTGRGVFTVQRFGEQGCSLAGFEIGDM
jgi:hypothetical protein